MVKFSVYLNRRVFVMLSEGGYAGYDPLPVKAFYLLGFLGKKRFTAGVFGRHTHPENQSMKPTALLLFEHHHVNI